MFFLPLPFGSARFGSFRFLPWGFPLRVAPVRYAFETLFRVPIHRTRWIRRVTSPEGSVQNFACARFEALRPVVANPSRAFHPSIVPTASDARGFHLSRLRALRLLRAAFKFGEPVAQSDPPPRFAIGSRILRYLTGFVSCEKSVQGGKDAKCVPMHRPTGATSRRNASK